MNTAQAPSHWVPNFMIPFVTLSYPTDRPADAVAFHDANYYGTGYLDLCVVLSFIIAMAIVRDITRIYVLEPFAKHQLTKNVKLNKQKQLGKKNGGPEDEVPNGDRVAAREAFRLTRTEERQMLRSVVRFAEQGWAFIYYTLQFSYGVYVQYQFSMNIFDITKGLWSRYPVFPLPGPVKFYYLNESAFYLHGIFILNAEARRKDHWQMMTHHFVAIALMFLSYTWNYTRIGCLIMVVMDCCDVLLPLAKMFKYLEYNLACDFLFGLFMISWAITRHAMFIRLIISTAQELPGSVPAYRWDPEAGYFITRNVYYGFVGLLIMLQVIQLVWFTMVIKVAYKVVSGQGAEDVRTEDEADDEDDKMD